MGAKWTQRCEGERLSFHKSAGSVVIRADRNDTGNGQHT